MKFAAYGLFYGYVGRLILAGAWGAVMAPLDFDILIGLELPSDDVATSNTLSQYRFLRAMEFGVGVVIFVFRREVFSTRRYRSLYLIVLGSGVAVRAISIAVDGRPSSIFLFFLASEFAGLVAFVLHTKRTMPALT